MGGNISLDFSEVAREEAKWTRIFNPIFWDDEISAEAKGMYCQLCSYPREGFVISEGKLGSDLGHIGEGKVRRILKELENAGYVSKVRERNNGGQFGAWRYTIHIDPKGIMDRGPRKAGGEDAEVDPRQMTLEEIYSEETVPAVIEKPAKPKKQEPVRHQRGSYGNVLLSDEEMNNLATQYGPEILAEAIEIVGGYCARNGKTYKNYAAALRSWGIKAAQENRTKTQRKSKNTFADMLAGMEG